METTNGFREEFSFLSNFAALETPIRHEGITYPTTEHYYQAMKFDSFSMRSMVAAHPSKGLKAFIHRNKKHIRKDWSDVKLKFMALALRWKFSKQNPSFVALLLATKGIELIEYNDWDDQYWGVCKQTRKGLNKLGKLLMKIRETL